MRKAVFLLALSFSSFLCANEDKLPGAGKNLYLLTSYEGFKEDPTAGVQDYEERTLKPFKKQGYNTVVIHRDDKLATVLGGDLVLELTVTHDHRCLACTSKFLTNECYVDLVLKKVPLDGKYTDTHYKKMSLEDGSTNMSRAYKKEELLKVSRGSAPEYSFGKTVECRLALKRALKSLTRKVRL